MVRQKTVIKEIIYGKNKLLMINDSSDYCKCFAVCMIRMIAFGVG